MNREKSEISVALKYCKEKLEGRVGRGKGVVKELDHQAQVCAKPRSSLVNHRDEMRSH